MRAKKKQKERGKGKRVSDQNKREVELELDSFAAPVRRKTRTYPMGLQVCLFRKRGVNDRMCGSDSG